MYLTPEIVLGRLESGLKGGNAFMWRLHRWKKKPSHLWLPSHSQPALMNVHRSTLSYSQDRLFCIAALDQHFRNWLEGWIAPDGAISSCGWSVYMRTFVILHRGWIQYAPTIGYLWLGPVLSRLLLFCVTWIPHFQFQFTQSNPADGWSMWWPSKFLATH